MKYSTSQVMRFEAAILQWNESTSWQADLRALISLDPFFEMRSTTSFSELFFPQ
jgi:hypothetical protein